jgi:hypothetical protein
MLQFNNLEAAGLLLRRGASAQIGSVGGFARDAIVKGWMRESWLREGSGSINVSSQ